MKNTLLCILLFKTLLPLFAQQEIIVSTETKMMSRGNQPCYVVTVPQNTATSIEKPWQEYVKKGSKGKPAKVNGEYQMPGAVNVQVSPNPFNVYAMMMDVTDGVKLSVFISNDDVNFYSEAMGSDRHDAAKKYVRDFAVLMYQRAVSDEIKTQQAKLKDLQKEHDNLVKEEDNNMKKNGASERSIEKNKSEITLKQREVETKNQQIAAQKELIQKLNNTLGNEQKAARETLKKLEREKDSLQKEIDKLNKDNTQSGIDIKNNLSGNEKLKQQQQAKQEEINQQQSLIKATEAKLAGIK